MRIILRVSQSVRASAEICFKIIMCATSAMKWTPKVPRFRVHRFIEIKCSASQGEPGHAESVQVFAPSCGVYHQGTKAPR